MTAQLKGHAGARVLQRLVLPADRDLDVMPLYIERGVVHASSAAGPTQVSGAAPVTDAMGGGDRDYSERPDAQAVSAPEDSAGVARQVTGRHSVTLPPGGRVSFGTYFNAFPASYWRRWTDVAEIELKVSLRGDATVIVYRSTSKGHVQRTAAAQVTNDEIIDVRMTLTLKPFIDGGWYWFDVAAGDAEVELTGAEWSTQTDRVERGSMTIGITTFNRPDFCVDQLRKLGEASDVLAVLDRVVVVDQGSQRVDQHPDYPAAAEVLGERLKLVEQGNLGGSGGFARAMAETLEEGRSDYILLLDDDVVTEPEGIIRGITFADLARRPTIVGGHMFSLYDRSVMHAYGEAVNQYRFFWGPAPNTYHSQNFATNSLRWTKWLHRRVDVDYNGWWMCLIPTSVIRDVGLALPMFIKWDDCEFGLRAGEAGHPTVTLPGMAVWHVPWHEKDDTIDWQAYFHCRNRFIGALLHSPYPYGGRLVRESMYVLVKHLLSMQYSAAELMLLAMSDLMSGPDHMHPEIVGKMKQIRELRGQFDDAGAVSDLEAYPAVYRRKPPRRGREATAPRSRSGMFLAAAKGAARQVLPVRDTARERPEAAVPHVDQRWWKLSQVDSAIVSSADGTSAAWYHRDPERFSSMLARGADMHTRLLREWPRLRQVYRDAVPELSSPEAWKATFEASTAPRR